MCSRVAASVAYATGSWKETDEPFDKPHTFGLDSNLERITENRNLLGHVMVVNSYQEYIDRGIFLGSSLKWGWMPIDTWKPERKKTRLVPVDTSIVPGREPLFPCSVNPRHIYTSYGFAATLRRRLFLSRESEPLFDTPRWVKYLENGIELAYAKYERDLESSTVGSRCIHVPESFLSY